MSWHQIEAGYAPVTLAYDEMILLGNLYVVLVLLKMSLLGCNTVIYIYSSYLHIVSSQCSFVLPTAINQVIHSS